MKKALVTGGTGFLGSHLAEFLLKKGYEVSVLVRSSSKRDNLDFFTGYKIVEGSLDDPLSLRQAVEGQDLVFHAAGLIRARSRDEFFEVNHLGTKKLLEAVAAVHPKLSRFIYVSSLAAAGPPLDGRPKKETDPCNPINPYGESKWEGEIETMKYRDKFPVTVIRPPAIYGPRDKGMFAYFKLASKGFYPLIGSGESFVNIISVFDLVEGIIAAAEEPKAAGEVFFLAEKKIYSWREAGEIIAFACGKAGRPLRIPKWVLFSVAEANQFVSNLFGQAALISRWKAMDLSQKYWTCDVSKAEKTFHFQTRYPLPDGAQVAYDWYKKMEWL
ncbi:MAG: NAD-dependent epimerase/dehydratase family protein [Limisphaerales bacterium]